MREPLEEFRPDHYQRPQQDWVCGNADEGLPCPGGPDARGHCPRRAACHPLREGDRWRCNRSEYRGGPCDEGPTPDGNCPHVYTCTPVRSMRARRGRWIAGWTVATLGALALLLSGNWRNEILAPGELAQPHAQLLARGQKTDRCASCHAAAEQSFLQWIAHAVDDELARPTQTELCMECHREQIEPGTELWPHNVDPQVLLALHTVLTSRHQDPTKPLACAACHREHHGHAHDLTWMSDRSCQACHAEQYHSFASDHPEFDGWPTARRTRIAFDHAAHELKHFPEEQQAYSCRLCHEQSSTGDLQATLPYEQTCAGCHDESLLASVEAGLPLVTLPMLDAEAVREAGHAVGQWPAAQQGEFDGALPPIFKFLLTTDPAAAAAMRSLQADFDFFDVDSGNAEQLAAAAEVIAATRRLLKQLAEEGQPALRRRVEQILGRSLTNDEFAALAARQSPESLRVISDEWLGEQISPAEADRERLRQQVAGGGWFRDDLTYSLRYRPTGHADPWLTAWLDVLAEAASSPKGELAETWLQQMIAPTAPGQCGSCHSVERRPNGELSIRWFAKQQPRGRSFTRFSHRPHVTQAPLADCAACHEADATANVMASYQQSDPHEFVDGFHAITKQSCAECHTPEAAGASCLKCHNYHVEP